MADWGWLIIGPSIYLLMMFLMACAIARWDYDTEDDASLIGWIALIWPISLPAYGVILLGRLGIKVARR